MVRRVGLCAVGALLTLGFAGIPAANAQTFVNTQINGDFSTWSEARRARALDAINQVDLSKQEIASILPLLRDLEDSERRRRADFGRLENDLLFARKGDTMVDSRVAEINAAHRDRVNKIWMTISERIGSSKAATLRGLVDDTVVDMSAYYDNSVRISRIDQIMIDWDKATAERIAMHERHNRLIQEQIAANERLRQETTVVTVVPAPEQPVVTETVVAPPPVVTTVRPVQPAARFHRSAPAKPVKRAKRVKGLG